MQLFTITLLEYYKILENDEYVSGKNGNLGVQRERGSPGGELRECDMWEYLSKL